MSKPNNFIAKANKYIHLMPVCSQEAYSCYVPLNSSEMNYTYRITFIAALPLSVFQIKIYAVLSIQLGKFIFPLWLERRLFP